MDEADIQLSRNIKSINAGLEPLVTKYFMPQNGYFKTFLVNQLTKMLHSEMLKRCDDARKIIKRLSWTSNPVWVVLRFELREIHS